MEGKSKFISNKDLINQNELHDVRLVNLSSGLAKKTDENGRATDDNRCMSPCLNVTSPLRKWGKNLEVVWCCVQCVIISCCFFNLLTCVCLFILAVFSKLVTHRKRLPGTWEVSVRHLPRYISCNYRPSGAMTFGGRRHFRGQVRKLMSWVPMKKQDASNILVKL